MSIWRLPFKEEIQGLFAYDPYNRVRGFYHGNFKAPEFKLHPRWFNIQNLFNSLEKTFWTSSDEGTYKVNTALYACFQTGSTYEGAASYCGGFVRLVRQGDSHLHTKIYHESERFKISGCGTYIVDNITGLEWKRDAEPERCDWKSAVLKYSLGAIHDSLQDKSIKSWRLPHKSEFIKAWMYPSIFIEMLNENVEELIWSSDDGACQILAKGRASVYSVPVIQNQKSYRVRLVRSTIPSDKNIIGGKQFIISVCGEYITDFENNIEWKRNLEPDTFTYDEAKKRFKEPSFKERFQIYTNYNHIDKFKT
ncbi:hypothetical protein [Alishewanella sp. HL-SH05]|uniref:hypothetical protein n=1 Tax=Alishewanella sp. HL-SH05 TaxID=3461145 RepID=UPI0040429561